MFLSGTYARFGGRSSARDIRRIRGELRMTRAIYYRLHPDHPERQKIARISDALRDGALALYPTDTVYALGCDPRVKSAIDRLRLLKHMAPQQMLTLLCPSLSSISHYAHMDDPAFKLMKNLTPGPYTFILKATKETPRLVQHPRRKTAGLRVPDHRICQALLAELEGLLVSTSARLATGRQPRNRQELFELFENQVEIIVDDDKPYGIIPSTVLDLTSPEQTIVREGLGMEALAPFVR